MTYFAVDMFDRESFFEEANALADKAPTLYGEAVKLYFFARYFVSVFEARNNTLPIQVWNEYRNALDHYMRFLTSDDYTTELSEDGSYPSQHREMKGHLQRAVLDIAKLTCHTNSDWIQKKLDRYDRNTLGLVDNGNFILEIDRKISDAELLFTKAKCEDKMLGKNSRQNNTIVEMYLNAVFEYEDARSKIKSKLTDIKNAQTNRKYFENKGAKISIKSAILIGLVANIMVGGLFYFLGQNTQRPTLPPAASEASTALESK